MMTVPMDNSIAPSSLELAERLYKKNIELDGTLRKFSKSRVPSDPNIWFQIRENYEAIILEDHDFSEKHEVELALWQLHYRRIEEFRTLLNAAKSSGSVSTQGGRTPPRPDSIKKIRSGFKTFLSESTGFYYDLILKIRAKFGLPLGHFPDGSESQIAMIKDETKSALMKKGLMSCHRSLIYLGDLARYKGSYGEGDSVSREYAAASSYYIQAASLCPSSGNPHHQLAILASYSANELVTIYRYFRSLAADIPFITARDNLIIAFEKNRQSFSQLPGNPKVVVVKALPARAAGRGRGRGDGRLLKDSKSEATPVKGHVFSIPELLRSFSTRFVRVNGILFTRTSLETFGEVFSSVKSDLQDLLSSGPEDELNFGQDATENALFIVRLIAILIFTVHNVNRESDDPSYAEILQRTVLLQNAFTAAFEFAGHIIKKCVQLRDATSSFLLPAILVFIEWLACHPDIAAGSDIEEKQVSMRSFFWNQFVTFMNKLLSTGLVSGDGDETCFFDMSQYDEGETGNRLALWEDFELRGFLPLVPAQLILDFSRQHSYGSDGSEKERLARVQRLFAAGRALMNVVRVDQKAVYFDRRLERFVIGIKPSTLDEYTCTDLPDAPKLNDTKQVSTVESNLSYGATHQTAHLHADVEDDEEEEIVFKPTAGDKYPNTSVSSSGTTVHETSLPAQISSRGEWTSYGAEFSTPVLPSNFPMSTGLHTSSPLESSAAAADFHLQPLLHMNMDMAKWPLEQAAVLPNVLKNLNIHGNGTLPASAFPFSPVISSSPVDPISRSCGLATVAPGIASDVLAMKPPGALPGTLKKAPVSRPVRHLGPPPGFTNMPSKQLGDFHTESLMNGQNPEIDDYRWLDGYQSSSSKASGMENSVNNAEHMYQHPNTDPDKLNEALSFPFPGKQVSTVQTQMANDRWQAFKLFDHSKPNLEQLHKQAKAQPPVMPEQRAHSLWSGYFV